MIRRTPTRRPALVPLAGRGAFTLVELLVTITIVLIMMSILATASSIAADTFRGAKVQGDFVAQERAALAVLRRDLQYPHFLEEDGKPNLGRRLSDQRLDKLTWYDAAPPPVPPAMATPMWRTRGYKPPKSGYFYADSRPTQAATGFGQDPAWNVTEGSDGDGFASTRSGNHVLQFTIIVPGGAPEDTLTATVPFSAVGAKTIVGRTAEVAYFLVANGTTPGGVNKYKLIRRQRLAAFNDDDKPAYTQLLNAAPVAPVGDASQVMAVNAAENSVFHLNDLTLAVNRLGGAGRLRPSEITTNRVGEDVLLSNVTSFEVKFTGTAVGFTWPAAFPGNSDAPYDNLPFDGKFDTFNSTQADWNDAKYLQGSPTGSSNSEMKRIRITGASIRLRCWNPSSKSSRQTTLNVDL